MTMPNPQEEASNAAQRQINKRLQKTGISIIHNPGEDRHKIARTQRSWGSSSVTFGGYYSVEAETNNQEEAYRLALKKSGLLKQIEESIALMDALKVIGIDIEADYRLEQSAAGWLNA